MRHEIWVTNENWRMWNVLLCSWTIVTCSLKVKFIQVKMLNFYLVDVCKWVLIPPPPFPVYVKEPLEKRNRQNPSKLMTSKQCLLLINGINLGCIESRYLLGNIRGELKYSVRCIKEILILHLCHFKLNTVSFFLNFIKVTFIK